MAGSGGLSADPGLGSSMGATRGAVGSTLDTTRSTAGDVRGATSANGAANVTGSGAAVSGGAAVDSGAIVNSGKNAVGETTSRTRTTLKNAKPDPKVGANANVSGGASAGAGL